MAYDAFSVYPGGQRDPYEEERLRQEEEERKRQEEEERMAKLAAVAGGTGFQGQTDEFGGVDEAVARQAQGPIAPRDDPLGAFIDKKMQGVKDRFGQVQQAFEDPARAFQERMNAATGATPVKPDEVVRKEQVETRADGTKVVKTTQEVPSAPVAPVPAAPVVAAPAAPGVSAALPADYNQRIAQMESGGRDDIGYHDRSKSSAFGKYGITDKAWSDAQRANPALAGVRKDQATPAQMEAAQSTVTSNNARYLTKLGVDVSPNTLAAAHFIGAQGLANYLRDGSISEGAIRANGGYEKTKQIIDQRLGGVAAPASGAGMVGRPPAEAAMPPAAPAPDAGVQSQTTVDEFGQIVASPASQAISPYSLATGAGAPGFRMPAAAVLASPASQAISTYQAVQDDPMALLKLRTDETVPAFIRERAGAQAYELLNRQRKTADAEQQVEKMVAAGDQTGIAKTLASKPKTEEGNFLKAVLFARLGLTDLAAEEQRKLGAGDKWTSITGPDGENALVKVAANGRPLEGVKSDGTAMSDNELVKFGGGGGALGKGASLSSEVYVDQATGQRYRSGFDASGKSAMVNVQGGAAYRGDPKNLKIQSIDTATQKAEGAAAVKFRYAAPTAYNEAGAAAAGKHNFEYGTRIGYLTQTPGAPLVDLTTGKPVPVVNGVISAIQYDAPGAAAQGAVPSAAVPAQTPAQIAGGVKTEQAVTQAEQEQFKTKTMPEVNRRAEDGRYIADTRRTQLAMLTGPDSAIMGIYRNSGSEYNKAKTIIADIIGGTYSGKDGEGKFADALMNLRIKDQDLAAIKSFQQMNRDIDSKTLAVNAGEGPKSDADMRMNREANMGNIGDLPAYSALNGLSRSQFAGDINKQKADFAANNNFKTETALNQAWGKEKDKMVKQYEGIYKERLNFIESKMVEKFGKDWRKQPGDTTQGFYRDASIHSFNVYATPNYNMQSGSWDYPTQQSKLAAMRAAVR